MRNKSGWELFGEMLLDICNTINAENEEKVRREKFGVKGIDKDRLRYELFELRKELALIRCKIDPDRKYSERRRELEHLIRLYEKEIEA